MIFKLIIVGIIAFFIAVTGGFYSDEIKTFFDTNKVGISFEDKTLAQDGHFIEDSRSSQGTASPLKNTIPKATERDPEAIKTTPNPIVFKQELPQKEMIIPLATSSEIVSISPPLKKIEPLSQAQLTMAGVVESTNIERRKSGLVELSQNAQLNIAALSKLNDMILGGYFAHVSPSGIGPSDIVKATGYEFIITAENLALGDFENDFKLVEGWMNSPGHRANILNSRFVEIGVAVGKGIYEGRMTWFAVQEFARPLSACPKPAEILVNTIEQKKSQISIIEQEINVLKEEMDKLKASGNISEYNQKVPIFNDLINQYNALIEDVKLLIAQYNGQIKEFNMCIML